MTSTEALKKACDEVFHGHGPEILPTIGDLRSLFRIAAEKEIPLPDSSPVTRHPSLSS